MTVRMSGFFTLADVARYGQAIGAATAKLGGSPDEQRMLSDISGMNIQSQEIVEAFRSFMANPRYAGRKIAFVVASTLARQQLQRAIGSRHARCFADVWEAERWLFSEEPTTAQPAPRHTRPASSFPVAATGGS